MEPFGLFTPEMGERLRELRKRAGLSQDEVAMRMGLSFKRRRTMVGSLERGRERNPSLLTLTRYLRAVGADWSSIVDLLDKRELPPLPPEKVEQAKAELQTSVPGGPGEQVRLPPESVVRVLAKTTEMAEEYQSAAATGEKHMGIAPARQEKAVAAYQESVLSFNVLQEKVAVFLGQYPMNFVQHAALVAFAKKVFGALRKCEKVSKPDRREALWEKLNAEAEELVRENGADMAIAEQVRVLVKSVYEGLRGKPTASN